MADYAFNGPMTNNPNNGRLPQTMRELVLNFKKNFLERDVEIVPGLYWNQYDTVKRIYYYIHNQFESGPVDDNNNPKYFYDMITDRNDQATKSINLDTKDCYIQAEDEGKELESWLLRKEFLGYTKKTKFGQKLNELADDLPDFGTVVWKKVKDANSKTDVVAVDLINIMNDPVAKQLSDGMFIERHLVTQDLLRGNSAYNQDKVEALIKSGRSIPNIQFMQVNGVRSVVPMNYVDEVTPYYETYEMWGEIPKYLFDIYRTDQANGGGGLNDDPNDWEYAPQVQAPTITQSGTATNDMVYVMAIISGVEDGYSESVLFCQEVDREQFPYKEVHYRRRKGRWLGLGNHELNFDNIEKANEITNRFFSSLRIAMLHLYQTRDKLAVRNVLNDLLDGDVVVTKAELTAIPTEIRGFENFRDEITRIEHNVDRICNTLDVVTGANLPSGTPFRLGQQMQQTATALFDYVKENIGLFIEDVFNSWLLKEMTSELTEEHILELMDDADDMEIYWQAKTKMFQFEMMKQYVLQTNKMPTVAQLQLVGSLVKDQFAKAPKQILVEKNYYANYQYSIKVVITGENDAKQEHMETIATTVQVLAANPQALQDPRFMKLLNIMFEANGFSPLEINGVMAAQPNPSLNPGMQGGNGVAALAAANGQTPGDTQPQQVTPPPQPIAAPASAAPPSSVGVPAAAGR